MTTTMIAQENSTQETRVRFSPRAAVAQLRFVWPGVVQRNLATVEASLAQVDEAFVTRFLEAHPRGDACAIARCGRHEIVLRGISRGEPVAYWVEGRLLGRYRAFGIFADELTEARAADPQRGHCAGTRILSD